MVRTNKIARDKYLKGDIASRYDILSAINRGSESILYKARPRGYSGTLNRIVALKVVEDAKNSAASGRERVLREALALKGAKHPNILSLYEYGAESDAGFLCVEFISGGDLGAKLESQPHGFAVDEALRLTMDILDGVGAIHDAGIIHRDIKPENLLLRSNGSVVICDFGIACLPGESPHHHGAAKGVGTFDYLAPEYLHMGVADVSTDLYAVGVTLFQLLTRWLPFSGKSIIEQIDQKLCGKRVPLAQFLGAPCTELEWLLDKALAPDPSKRFRSAQEFRRAVVEVRAWYENKSRLAPQRSFVPSRRLSFAFAVSLVLTFFIGIALARHGGIGAVIAQFEKSHQVGTAYSDQAGEEKSEDGQIAPVRAARWSAIAQAI